MEKFLASLLSEMNSVKLIIASLVMTLSISANGKSYLAPMLLEAANSAADENTTITLKNNNVALPFNSESTVFRANMSEPGTLADVIGEKLYDIGAIEVIGPMNDVDFNTLWKCSFKGQLKTINLENAVIENGIIPDQAFFHIHEQMDWSTLVVTTIWLEELILPEGITGIGEFAVAYAINLNSLKLPSTLKKIGKSAFTDCIELSPDVFTLPASLEHIENQAFYQCRSLKGELILPDGLKSIKTGAFYHAKISNANFPESLEYIGADAFSGCNLESISLPNDCWLEWEGGQFYNNTKLTEAHLPENATFIPKDIFSGCRHLKNVNIPQNIERIGEFAFDGCGIAELQLPETLKRIDQDAFQGCYNLNTILLPASLTTIETHAFFLCHGLKSVYSKATTPPECVATGFQTEIDPFSQVDKTIPLYVPVGTKNAYQTAQGWDTFQNIIETDNFPSASIDTIYFDPTEKSNCVYDLSGRRVTTPSKGQIYIKGGRKFIFTE